MVSPDPLAPSGLDAHDPETMHGLVLRLWPIVSARVQRVVRRKEGMAPSRERLEDLVQEVFVSLLEADRRALKSWRTDGGLSFDNFVGLLAERRVLSLLRPGPHRFVWAPDPTLTDGTADDHVAVDADFEIRAMSRDLLNELLDRLQETLSPLGMHLFEALYVDQLAVDAAAARVGMSVEAVYKWRQRLRQCVARLAVELQGSGERGAHGRGSNS